MYSGLLLVTLVSTIYKYNNNKKREIIYWVSNHYLSWCEMQNSNKSGILKSMC